MTYRRFLSAGLALAVMASPAVAQNAFDTAPSPRPATAPAPRNDQQGFSFQGDQLPPSHDRPYVGQYNDRYSQTYQQQQAEAQRPGGGCLRYGAVGAAGGHLAHHTILGAVAGCAAGVAVRRRDEARIRAQQQGQAQQ